MKIVLATHNQGKIREFRKAFAEIGWEALPIAEVADVAEPEETGTSFKENALLKAHYYAKAVKLPVLSDDSGIIADALGDRPGIYSARYAGVHGDDEANNRKLVEDLKPYTGEDRKGRYVCVVALVWPDGKEITAEGTCEGIIRISTRERAASAMIPFSTCPGMGKLWRNCRWKKKIKSAIVDGLSVPFWPS